VSGVNNNTQVVSTENALHVYNTGGASVLTVTKDDGKPVATEVNAAPKPTKRNANATPAEGTLEVTNQDWAPWGDNDDFPERLLEKLDKLGVMKSALDVNGDMHYGGGIVWAKDIYTEEGKLVRKLVNIEGWKQWLRDTAYEVTHGEIVDSLEIFYIAFPLITLGDDGKVAHVRLLDTPRTRLQRRDSSGAIKNVYYNVHGTVSREKVKPIPIYDPANPRKFRSFVYPIMYRTLGKIYYPEPNYYATFRAGWADVAIKVASFMKNVYTNMITIKYHLRIPLSSLKTHYKDWDTKTEEQQIAAIVEFKNRVDDYLAGNENAGKSVYSVFDDHQNFKHVEIEPIKNFLDIASELPSNIAANSEMLFAAGTDPALVGLNNPGGGDLNGSGGSDKRESRKSKQGNLKRERAVSLQLLNLIAYLNGYDADVYPTYLDVDTSQTMDENPTGKKTITT
jgi:hypothetical protein